MRVIAIESGIATIGGWERVDNEGRVSGEGG